MAKVQSLADAMLMRVFLHNTLLHLYRLCHHALQLCEVGLVKVEAYKLCPMVLVGYESVLKHFGVARADVLVVERIEERGVDYHETAVRENAYLIL